MPYHTNTFRMSKKKKKNPVKTNELNAYTIDVFRTQSKIYDGAFSENRY